MSTKREMPEETVRPATAIRASSSMLEQRKRIADKFITGEWGLELSGFEEGRDADQQREKRVFSDLAERLADSSSVDEQKRLKEQLARMTFGE